MASTGNIMASSFEKKIYSEIGSAPVVCDEKTKCPDGTFCLKIYGDTGFCVLTSDSILEQ